MRLFHTPSILLLFAALSTSLGYRLQNVDVPGCGHVDASHSRYLYFTEPSETHQTLAIVTQWYYYAQELQRVIRAEGFEFAKPPSPRGSPAACGWQFLFGVSRYGINHGHVIFKNYEHAPSERSMNFTLKYEDNSVSDDERLPSHETIQRVRTILVSHAPVRDILEIIMVVTVPVTGAAILLIMAYTLILWWYRDDDSSIEEVEMTQFKTTGSQQPSDASPPSYPDSVRDRFAGVVYSFGKGRESGTIQAYRVSTIQNGRNSYPVTPHYTF
jgi:hypothetical protein